MNMKFNLSILSFLLISASCFSQQVFERYYTFGTWTRGEQVLEIPGKGYYVIGLNDSLSFDSVSGQPILDYYQGIVVKLDYNGDTLKTFQIGNSDTMYSYLYGGNSDDKFRTAIITDDAHILIGGETQSYGADNFYDYDLWMLKLDSNLNLIWNKQFSVPDTQILIGYASGRKLINGGIVIPGYAHHFTNPPTKFRLSAIDANGVQLLSKTILPNLSGEFLGACGTSDGGYMAAGLLFNVVQNNNLSPIIVKTDSAGNTDWYHVLPYSGDLHEADDVMATFDGNYVYSWANVVWQSGAKKVWIPHLTKIDIYGNEIWTKDYGYSFDMLRRIKELPNGNIMVTGWYVDTVGTGRQALLQLFDTNGNTLWTRKFSGFNGPSPGDLPLCMDGIYTSDGGFILTGETACCNFTPNLGWTTSLWVLKTDSMGLITSLGSLDPVKLDGTMMISIFPNPVSDYCTVTSLVPPSRNIGYGEKGACLLLFDMQGKQLQNIDISTGLNHTRIDLESYSKGEYIVVLVLDGYNAGARKIVVQR